MRTTIGLIFTAFGAWGSLAQIAGHYGLFLYPPPQALHLAMLYTAPWLAIYCGLILWNRARAWRRARERRYPQKTIIRNPDGRTRAVGGPGVLERFGAWTLVLGLAALPYWFEVSAPVPYLIAGVMVYAFARFAGHVMQRA